jgi:tetratricopeptide (TPR) repeat protein
MKNTFSSLLISILIFTACGQQKEIDDSQSIFLTPETMCGTVEFTDGCGEKTDTLVRFGIALLHHMTYEDAAYTFDQVMKKDRDCFWGYWGRAMTYIHPLWPDAPSEKEMETGYVLTQKALALAKKDKEKLYGAAVAAYYIKSSKIKSERLADMQKGWQAAHDQFPDDPEAELFNGLFRLSTASPNDKTYAVQKEVGEMAERLMVKFPDHPGAFHYAIHAYDTPPLADRAVAVARKYGKIAPEIPHALHMPSHIFTRVGYWQESIDWNARSLKAAGRSGYGDHHNYHSADYMVYAMLQFGADEQARAIWNQVDKTPHSESVTPSVAYAMAAMPARLELEGHHWDAASKIANPDTANFPWKKYPQYEALYYAAQGIGAARSGNLEKGKDALDKLIQIQVGLGDAPQNKYWFGQVEIQKVTVSAWNALAAGNKEEALTLMIQAADLEDGTTKNAVSPGSLLPARELLGDMLMELNRPKDALAAYEQSLVNNPNRYNTYLGAALAAEKMKDMDKAKEYYEKLIALKGEFTSNRESLEHAKEVVAKANVI